MFFILFEIARPLIISFAWLILWILRPLTCHYAKLHQGSFTVPEFYAEFYAVDSYSTKSFIVEAPIFRFPTCFFLFQFSSRVDYSIDARDVPCWFDFQVPVQTHGKEREVLLNVTWATEVFKGPPPPICRAWPSKKQGDACRHYNTGGS